MVSRLSLCIRIAARRDDGDYSRFGECAGVTGDPVLAGRRTLTALVRLAP